MADLQRLLESEPVAGQRFIVTDGVFSMDGDIADLPTLVKLKERFDACLIVDDAHGVGVIGSDGSGTAAHYGLLGKIDMQIGTLSKALASEGGYVAGKKIIIELSYQQITAFYFLYSVVTCRFSGGRCHLTAAGDPAAKIFRRALGKFRAAAPSAV